MNICEDTDNDGLGGLEPPIFSFSSVVAVQGFKPTRGRFFVFPFLSPVYRRNGCVLTVPFHFFLKNFLKNCFTQGGFKARHFVIAWSDSKWKPLEPGKNSVIVFIAFYFKIQSKEWKITQIKLIFQQQQKCVGTRVQWARAPRRTRNLSTRSRFVFNYSQILQYKVTVLVFCLFEIIHFWWQFWSDSIPFTFTCTWHVAFSLLRIACHLLKTVKKL